MERNTMAWESRNGRGRYCTRSVRCGGRVIREYVGAGEAAELIAAIDEERAALRRDDLRATPEEFATMQAVEAGDMGVCSVADLLARLALVATGHHQHHRGEWRRKREQT
jgi:hypothetical protein